MYMQLIVNKKNVINLNKFTVKYRLSSNVRPLTYIAIVSRFV